MLHLRSLWAMAPLVLLLSACSSFGTQIADVTVEVNDVGFQPTIIEIAAGKTAKLTLKNSGIVEHQFGISEIPLATGGGEIAGHNMAGMDGAMAAEAEQLQVHLVAAPGTATSLELTPTKADEYTFRCVAPGHTEQGILVVTR